MSKNIEIQANLRNAGKGQSRQVRKSDFVPAVVYGPQTENISLCIPKKDAVKYTAHGFENSIFTLKSDDKKLNQLKVLLKDVDTQPGTNFPIHIDFYAPDMSKTVRVYVEIKFEGKALGTAEGGLVNYTRREVEVECLPTEIPEFLVCDISNLALNHSMHVSDIKIPAGVKMITSAEEAIANCAVVAEEVLTPQVGDATAAAATEGAAAAPAAGAAAAAPADKK